MAEKIRKMGAFVAGIILVVIGALMLAEGVITLMGNSAFLFVDNMNRGFELVVGLVTIIVAAATLDSSKV
jgi:predicted metal-binding membrane protein